jgi:hypothetical protein
MRQGQCEHLPGQSHVNEMLLHPIELTWAALPQGSPTEGRLGSSSFVEVVDAVPGESRLTRIDGFTRSRPSKPSSSFELAPRLEQVARD